MENKQQALAALERLMEVTEVLRSEQGCPWDRAQTHESLRTHMIEEAYEAAWAMHQYTLTGEADNLKEELGDVLFQVMLNSVIGEEEGCFTLTEVTKAITEKMIHRHPRVFQRQEWEQAEHKKSWEELKAEEKGHDRRTVPPLHQIPGNLPALMKTTKVLKKADSIYEKKTTKEESGKQLILLSRQLNEAEDKLRKQELMTAMSYHLCNIAWQENINLEESLSDDIQQTIENLETT
jgi:tetrapyrrole methylase family protein/MazG family protein